MALPAAEIPDTIPVSSTTDWQAAFGFTPSALTSDPGASIEEPLISHIDDDLGELVKQFIFPRHIFVALETEIQFSISLPRENEQLDIHI